MIIPHPNYRLNPSRAIYISGVIDGDLVTRLTPEILQLQGSGRGPICVYIDSPGGPVSGMEAILRLLKLSDQDRSAPCHIITAVTTRAGSAAADLLSSGDYAVAFPTSTILYHGVRRFERNPLTLESTSMLADSLRMGNDAYAMRLAHKIEDRFSYRYVSVREEFDNVRTKKSAPGMSDLDCFIEIIADKLSRDAQKIWNKAKERHGRYQDLLDCVLSSTKKSFAAQTVAEVEAASIKAIIAFELKRNKKNPDWSFRSSGMGRLVEDFFLLNEHIASYSSDRLMNWCRSFGRWTLPPEEVTALDAITDEKERAEQLVAKVRPILQPIWSFFVALCHALQEGENELTATDAYWLGLVDEVVGETLWTIRYIAEYKADVVEPNEKEKTSEEQTIAAGA